MTKPSDGSDVLDLAHLLRAAAVKRGTRLNWASKHLVDDPATGRYSEWHVVETVLVRELANALPNLGDVQAIRGSRGDDLIAAMRSVGDSLDSLHIAIESGTLACRTVQPEDRAVDAIPLGRAVVLLRLDDAARQAVDAFRRFSRHVVIDFSDRRRRSGAS